MTSSGEELVIAALVRIAEALEQNAHAQERIAVAFEREPAGDPPSPCQLGQHPHEWRTSHAVMGHPEWYVCDSAKGGCGFQNF